MANVELTDIERETFPALPQLYDLVKLSPTGYLEIARVGRTNSRGIKENAIFSGEETTALIDELSKCYELFVTNDIQSVPDKIALSTDSYKSKSGKGEERFFQDSLLDTTDFREEVLEQQLTIAVYFSKNSCVILHVTDVKTDNPKGSVIHKFPSKEKYKGIRYIELTEELKDLFVLAQSLVMKKAMNGELEGIEFNHE